MYFSLNTFVYLKLNKILLSERNYNISFWEIMFCGTVLHHLLFTSCTFLKGQPFLQKCAEYQFFNMFCSIISFYICSIKSCGTFLRYLIFLNYNKILLGNRSFSEEVQNIIYPFYLSLIPNFTLLQILKIYFNYTCISC